MDESEIICMERVKLEFDMETHVSEINEYYLYNMKGILIETNQDLCDCNDEECPGCFNPCEECSSNKCGHMCRVHRTWRYGKVEDNDGAEEEEIDPEKEKRKLL